ncbi:MAG: cyclic nucleotide-binding domain-containing protein [Acidimicrobiia bacterium]
MARSDSYLDALASVPLFSACSKKELQLVAHKGEHRTVEAGTTLVTEGAAGAEFFVILDGTARVERHGKKVAQLGPGNYFGELSLLDRAPRNATVVAETPIELVVLGQRAFDELLDSVPQFDKRLLAGLARRLRLEDLKTVQ